MPTSSLGRRELGREPAVRPGAGDAAARTAASAAPVPAPGSSGARRSSAARGADQLDGEDAARGWRRAVRSLRAAAPAHRHVVLLHRAGRQRVDARRRGEAAVLGDHRRLRVLGDHQPGVDARRRRPGTAAGPCERLASSRRSVRRSAIAPTSATAIARKSQAKPSGAPWKLPHDSTRPSGSTIGLSIAERSSARGDPLGVRERVARGAVHLRRAAQRVGVLHAGVAVAVAGDDRRARRAARAGWRRSPPGRAAGAARPGRRRRRGRCRAAPRPTSRR